MAAGMREQQRRCGYRRESMVNGVTYVAESYAMRLVLENKIDDVIAQHRGGGASVTTVLEYSSKRGRHKMTRSLVAEGVTVTHAAIRGAAKLGGPGVDLLLAGIEEGQALEMAHHDALYARIYYGDFDKAIEMLESGVVPSELCYSGLETGAKRDRRGADDWRERVQPLLDLMIPRTPIEQFIPSTLQVIVDAGRPIHIERTLAATRRPPSFLLLPALEAKAYEAITTLRQLGMRVDDLTFAWLSDQLREARWVNRTRIHEVLREFVTDSGQTMRAEAIQPLLRTVLDDMEIFIRRISGPDVSSYKLASEVLMPFINTMDPSEHLKLYDAIDRWATRAGVNTKIAPAAIAVMKHTVQMANDLAQEQLFGLGRPTP